MRYDPTQFLSLSSPAFSILALPDGDFWDILQEVQVAFPGEIAVRVCRGHKMRTVEDLFDEVAAAFQFPYYFGENWAALDECMSDLSWLPAGAYLLAVVRADELLADAAVPALEVFIRILQNQVEGWAGSNPDLAVRGQTPAPFRILLQTRKREDVESVRRKLGRTGIDIEVLEVPGRQDKQGTK